jgi:hypothetical protein
VSNPANISQQVAFNVALPDSAFISGFHMCVSSVALHSETCVTRKHVSSEHASRPENVQRKVM